MNEFEKACSEVEQDETYETEVENCIEFLKDAKTATVTFSQGRYITKIKKLAEKYPDQVQIVHSNKNSIVAHIPVKAIKISIIEGRERTEEEIERAKVAFAKYREEKKQSLSSDVVETTNETT